MGILLAISVLVAVTGVLTVAIGRSTGTDRASWSGVLVGVVGVAATVFFGIQAHGDSTGGGTHASPSAAPPSTPSPEHIVYVAEVNQWCRDAQAQLDKAGEAPDNGIAAQVRWTTAAENTLKSLYSKWAPAPYPEEDKEHITAMINSLNRIQVDVNLLLTLLEQQGQARTQAVSDGLQNQVNATIVKISDDYNDIDDAIVSYGDLADCRSFFTSR